MNNVEKKHVLFVLPSLSQANGVVAFAKNYLPRMTDENLDFNILCSDKNFSRENYDYFFEKGIGVIMIPDAGECGVFDYSYYLDKFFKENNEYDLVYAHNGYLSFFIYLSAKKFGIKNFALHSHATKMSPNKLKNLAAHILKPLINHFYKNKFSCSTEAGLELFNTKNFTLIPNAIDYNKYKFDDNKRKEIRSFLNIGENEKCAGFVGRFTSQKNVYFFIDLAKKVDNVKFLMIGEGELKNDFEKKLEEDGLTNKFILLDACSNVNEYYSAMDVFVLPSLYEGLPVVAIEAQANYLPCLLADTISKETSISKLTKYLPLSDIDLWVKEIENSIRENQVELQDSFDIEKQAEKYKEKILNCCRK